MNQLSRRLFSLRNISILKRSFGGHAPKGKEPFPTFEWKKETPQEGRYYTNEDEATFCSQKPGDTLEGWEPIAAIGVVIMIYFSYDFFTAPDNSLEVRFFIFIYFSYLLIRVGHIKKL